MPRKEKSGVVVSNKMDKTIVVAIEEHQPHSKYGKYATKTSKFHAHDPQNECHLGDIVRIEESRPLSKTKSWRLVEILQRAQEV